MKSKYTFDYNDRIEKLLDEVLKNIGNEIGNSPIGDSVKYVVLGGGYGRGEGGVFVSDDGAHLFNDLDFFVISKTDDPKKCEAINAFFADMSPRYSAQLGIDVDFGAAKSVDYVAKRLNILMWREMVLGANVVYGSSEEFYRDFKIAGGIPNVEFAKLMLNRLSGLVFARKRLERKTLELEDSDFIARNINKCVLACTDVFLASRGVYKFHTLERLEAVRAQKLPDSLKNLASMYAQAVEFKRSPHPYFERKVLLNSFAEASSLAMAVLDCVGSFLYKPDTNPFRLLLNFRNQMKVRKYFTQLGVSSAMFQNPIYPALKVLVDMLRSETVLDADIASFVEIWKRIN